MTLGRPGRGDRLLTLHLFLDGSQGSLDQPIPHPDIRHEVELAKAPEDVGNVLRLEVIELVVDLSVEGS